MSPPSVISAASVAGALAQVAADDGAGIYKQASSATTVSILVPEQLKGKFIDFSCSGVAWGYAYSRRAAQTISLTAVGTWAAPNAQCCRDVAAGDSIDKRVPGRPGDGVAIYLNVIAASAAGYFQGNLSEALGG